MTESIKAANKRSRQKRQNIVMDNKTPCVKCGESRKYIIDWHHKNPSKKLFDVGRGAKERGIDQVLFEISKCVCLCRNCHSEFHYLYGQDASEKDLKLYLAKEKPP